jgi:hypothetical protein
MTSRSDFSIPGSGFYHSIGLPALLKRHPKPIYESARLNIQNKNPGGVSATRSKGGNYGAAGRGS